MLKKYIYLIITGILFGSQFLLTSNAMQGYTPLEVGMMRIIFGFLTVVCLAPFFSKSDDAKMAIRWYHYAIIGFLEGTLPCVLVPWGQQHVQSGIAAVIVSTMPIFAMIFGPLMIKSEKYDWVNVASIIVGFMGVCILINPGADVSGFVAEIIPELAILLASACWAMSLMLIKKLPEQSPLLLTRNILFAATIEIIPVWLIIGHPAQIQLHMMPLLNAIALGVFTLGIVYVFYILLIRSAGVNFAAFSNYILPIVGGILGVVFLKEKFSLQEVIGFMIIVAGLLIQTCHDFIKKRAAA